MGQTFRLDLKRSWEVIDIQTGAHVLLPKGSHKALRIMHRTDQHAGEEPWLVVSTQHQGKSIVAGLREAYWRQWEGHHIPEFRVVIEQWREYTPRSTRKTRP